MTALHIAGLAGTPDSIEKLLNYSDNVDVNAETTHPATPLFLAAKRGDLDIVKLLVEAGADLNYRGGPFNETPIMVSAHEGHEEIVEYLGTHGANLSTADSNRN